MAITLEDVVNARQQWQPPKPDSNPSGDESEDTNLKEIMPWFEKQQAASLKDSPLASIKPAKIPQSGSNVGNDPDSVQKYIIGSALQRDLDPVKSLAYLWQESNHNVGAVGGGGEHGIGQFTSGTAKSRGLDFDRLLKDPAYSIDSSLDYLKELTDKHGGDIHKGLEAYNGGGDPNYLQNVLRHVPQMSQLYAKHLPSIMNDISQGASTETAQSTQRIEPQEPSLLGEAGRRAVGAGEAYASLLTGIPAFAGGALGYATGLASGAVGAVSNWAGITDNMHSVMEPHFFENLSKEFSEFTSRHTYQPQTPEGQRAAQVLMGPFAQVHNQLESSRQSAVNLGVPEDISYLIRDASEVAAFYVGDKAFHSMLPEARSTVSRMKTLLDKESGEAPSPELVETAQRLNDLVSKNLSASEALASERGKLVEALKARETQLQEQAPSGTPEEAQAPTPEPTTGRGAEVLPPESPLSEAAGETSAAVGESAPPSQSPQLGAETPAAPQPHVTREGRVKGDLQIAMEELDPRWRSKYPNPEEVPEQELSTKLSPTIKPRELSKSVIETPQGEILDQAPGIKDATPEGVITDKGVRLGVRPQRGPRTRQLDLGDAEVWNLLRKDNSNPSEPTKFTGQEKADYIKGQTQPISQELRERMENAIERGEEISDQLGKDIRQPVRIEYSSASKAYQEAKRAYDRLPKLSSTPEEIEASKTTMMDAWNRLESAKKARDLADEFKTSLETERKGIGSSSDRSVMDILKDLKTAIWEWDINPNSLGMNFSDARLSRRQRMALQRLQDDAARYGENIGDFLEAFHQGVEGMELTPAHITLFRNYLDQIKNPPLPSGVSPANMRLDASALDDDPVVSQRKEYPKGTKLPKETPDQPLLPGMPQGVPTNEPLRTFPPIYKSEAQAIYSAKEIPPRPLRIAGTDFGIEIPYNTLKNANLLDPLYYSYRTVNRAASSEAKQIVSDLNSLRSSVDAKSRSRIAADAYSRDAEGLVILDNLGRSAEPLNANEQAASGALLQGYKELFDRVNRTRESIGLDQIPEPDNHFLFARTWNALHALGKNINLLSTPADEIVKYYDDNMATPFPTTFTQRRLGMNYEMDPFTQFEQYSNRVSRQTHFAPFTAKLNELINEKLPDPTGAVDPKTGEVQRNYSLQAEKPELWKWLNDWKNDIDGKGFFTTKFDSVMRKLNENEVYSVISLNLGPALAQVSSLPKVAYETTPYHALWALEKSLEDVITKGATDNRGEALRKSEVLSTIKTERMYGDYASSYSPETIRGIRQALGEGRIRDISKSISRGGTVPVQFLDIETSIMAFNAAYKYGSEKLGLEGRDLTRYADDVVVRTQHMPGVGDRAPIQRSQLGRTLTLFQSYTIKEWNWLTRDVLGYANPVSITNRQALINVAKLIALTTAWNILSEDVFHVPSALPTPIRDAQRVKDKGGNPLQIAGAFLAGTARVPIVSGARYGQGMLGPVGTSVTQTIPNMFTGKDQRVRPSQSAVEQGIEMAQPVGQALGVTGLSQTMKLYRAIKRGEQGQVLSPWDRFTGWNEPPSQGGGGSLEGLRGGGLRGGLRGLRR